MNPVKNFLDRLTTDPQVKDMMKGMKEPAGAEEAADQYVAVAEKIGIALTREQILGFLKAKEDFQQTLTAKAEEQVEKAALSEENLEAVAGGVGDPRCESTFDKGEWCWFSDSCSVIITGYSAAGNNTADNNHDDDDDAMLNAKLSYQDTHCTQAVLTDGGNTCLNNVFDHWGDDDPLQMDF